LNCEWPAMTRFPYLSRLIAGTAKRSSLRFWIASSRRSAQ
jgi:hypothetical protein